MGGGGACMFYINPCLLWCVFIKNICNYDVVYVVYILDNIIYHLIIKWNDQLLKLWIDNEMIISRKIYKNRRLASLRLAARRPPRFGPSQNNKRRQKRTARSFLQFALFVSMRYHREPQGRKSGAKDGDVRSSVLLGGKRRRAMC